VSLPCAVIFGLNSGAVDIPIQTIIDFGFETFQSSDKDTVTQQVKTILFDIRLPRICLAILIGVIFVISGAVM
jgi:ABC-type Fe3+-siderophore transport system permease subunit